MTSSFEGEARSQAPEIVPAFGLTLFRESPKQLDWCLGNVREAYPNSPVFCLTDGPDLVEWRTTCEKHEVEYLPGERLKLVEHGCRWWHRWFTTMLAAPAERLIKIDADTWVRRPFGEFPDLDVCGTAVRRFDIQGGCQILRRSAAERIVASGVCLDPLYTDIHAWGSRLTKSYTRSFKQISSDHSLAHIVKRLHLRWGSFDEVDCQWRVRRPFREGVAVTHPHRVARKLPKPS